MSRASDEIHIADPGEAAILQEGLEGYESCGCWILASVSPLQEFAHELECIRIRESNEG